MGADTGAGLGADTGAGMGAAAGAGSGVKIGSKGMKEGPSPPGLHGKKAFIFNCLFNYCLKPDDDLKKEPRF